MHQHLEIRLTAGGGMRPASTGINFRPDLVPTWGEALDTLGIHDTRPRPGDLIEVRHVHTGEEPSLAVQVLIAHRSRVALDDERNLPVREVKPDEDPLATAAALAREVLATVDGPRLTLHGAARDSVTGTLILTYVGSLHEGDRDPPHWRSVTSEDAPALHAALEHRDRTDALDSQGL